MSSVAVLSELTECLCATMEEAGSGLCWCGLYPGGSVPFDFCGSCDGDSCGMGFVTVTGGSKYTSFGEPDASWAKCASAVQVTGRIGVLRCFPLEVDGSLPSLDVLESLSLRLAADMLLMKKAALCCFGGDIMLEGYDAISAQGGCVGGQWQFTLDLG